MTITKLLFTLLCLGFTNYLLAQEIETKVPYKIGGSTQKAFKETSKVAIGYFGISQTVQNSASSTAAGGAAFAKMTVNFGGVDFNAYQALLKEAYDSAVSKLRGLGYDVMTPEQLQATGEETYTPDNTPESYKANSNTIVAVNIQPAVSQLKMDMTPLGSNPMMKKAKNVNANLMNFVFGATAVGFDRGSKFGKKAKVAASPYLTFGGYLNTYPIGKGGSPAVISVGSKEGAEDFAGEKGLYETEKTDMPWLGSSRGKYILDIDQNKYLALVRGMLMQAVEKSIAKWHEELND